MEKYESLLHQTIEIAKHELNTSDFNDIFKTVPEVFKYEKNYIYIIFPDPLTKFRVEKFYISKLNEILERVAQEKINFKLITKEEAEKEKRESNIRITEVEDKPKQNNVYFRHEYTFENFMVGESNRFAFLSAMKVAENPHVTYNPLYIFGDVGLGKTHLMTAVGQYIMDKNINANIVYVNTNLFVEEYFLATSTKAGKENIASFYNKYRNADVLLVDDIQFLNNKTASQEEFFKIFEYLHTNNKQIILTSDRAASDLENMMSRLKSRFNWGLSVDIKSPDKKLRISILKSKLKFLIRNVNDVSEEALELIADYFPNNIRELEGALRRFINYCVTLDIPFTAENAMSALEGILSKNQKNKINDAAVANVFTEVKNFICNYYHPLSLAELESTTRKQSVTYPRQMAMYILKNVYNTPLNQIGNAFGGRDHTTVSHGIDKITSMIKENPMVKKDYETIVEKLKNAKKWVFHCSTCPNNNKYIKIIIKEIKNAIYN